MRGKQVTNKYRDTKVNDERYIADADVDAEKSWWSSFWKRRGDKD